MNLDEIRNQLVSELAAQQVDLKADGNKLMMEVISSQFDGLSKVKRQKMVYAILSERIGSGEIHAVSMITLTPEEAQNR